MGHPRRRTWTLSTLERDVTYSLFFDAVANRWEVRHPAHLTGTLTTRPPASDGSGAPAGPQAQRGPAGVRPAAAAARA
jgi:hypothetical protein